MLCDTPWELEIPGLSSTALLLSAPEPIIPQPPVLTVYEISDKPVTLSEFEIRPESAVRSKLRLLSWIRTEVRVPSPETDVLRESPCVSDVGSELSYEPNIRCELS